MFQLVLSLVGRKKLVTVNVFLNALQVYLGTSLVLLAVWACLGSWLHPADRSLLRLVFAMIACYGLLVDVLGIQGVRLSATYFSASLRPRLGFELAVWTIVATLATIIGIGFMFALPPTTKSFLVHMQNSMFRGLSQYVQDSSWKRFYDDIQVKLECCGVIDNSDWRTTSWIPLEKVRENSRTILDYTKADGRTLPPVVPYSCCKLGTGRQCLHDKVQQKDLFIKLKDNKERWWKGIHQDGCYQGLSSSVNHEVNIAIVIILFTCIIFLVTIALSCYIHLRSKGRGIDGIFRRKKNSKHQEMTPSSEKPSGTGGVFRRKKNSSNTNTKHQEMTSSSEKPSSAVECFKCGRSVVFFKSSGLSSTEDDDRVTKSSSKSLPKSRRRSSESRRKSSETSQKRSNHSKQSVLD